MCWNFFFFFTLNFITNCVNSVSVWFRTHFFSFVINKLVDFYRSVKIIDGEKKKKLILTIFLWRTIITQWHDIRQMNNSTYDDCFKTVVTVKKYRGTVLEAAEFCHLEISIGWNSISFGKLSADNLKTGKM